MIDPVPDGSIYFWCYTQGLKHVYLSEVETAVEAAGKRMRQKDYDNYWNGWRNSNRDDNGEYKHRSILDIEPMHRSPNTFYVMEYSEYPDLPSDESPEDRFIPVNKEGKPMIKWGKGGMKMDDALFMYGCCSLAENMKGCNFICIDIDGDHDEDNLDIETIKFGHRLSFLTRTYIKPKYIEEYKTSPSMHVMFKVDRVIPTRHFPNAHIDILGNKENQARYHKDKLSNYRPMLEMNDCIWNEIVNYIKRREGVVV